MDLVRVETKSKVRIIRIIAKLIQAIPFFNQLSPFLQIMFSFLSVGWGLISDIDIESERLRAIGGQRFTLWSIARLIGKYFQLTAISLSTRWRLLRRVYHYRSSLGLKKANSAKERAETLCMRSGPNIYSLLV